MGTGLRENEEKNEGYQESESEGTEFLVHCLRTELGFGPLLKGVEFVLVKIFKNLNPIIQLSLVSPKI